MRIATYVRVSTAQQDDGEKTSLTEQSSACDAYATSHGWEIVNRYSDVGSGADSTRPGFLQLLDATRNGEIDGVLTWKPDRLYRALGPAADLADALESDKAEFHSVQDAVDAKSLPLYAAVAALERSGIKERMALGKLGAAKAGKVPTGLLSMGYRRGEDGRPVIHQAEAEIVKRIYQWSIERLGAKEIAARLNDDGVRNRNGSRWYTSLIWRILEKPTYKGDWQYDGVEVSFPPIMPPKRGHLGKGSGSPSAAQKPQPR